MRLRRAAILEQRLNQIDPACAELERVLDEWPAHETYRARSGVRHSEANPSTKDPVHLLQIWITPDRSGHQPGYEQKSFPEEEKRGRFLLIASPDGDQGSVMIHQDAKLYVSLLSPSQQVEHELGQGRFGWLQVAKGAVDLNGRSLKQGDGAATDDPRLIVSAGEESEILLFDLA